MAARWTTIRATDSHSSPGLQLPDRVSRAEAVSQFRAYYTRQLQQAQLALSVPDDDLVVETHLGVHVRRNVERVTG